MQSRRLPSLLVVSLLLVACSGAPPTPVGEQRLTDARNNLKASDFNAALTNLDFAIQSAGDEPAGQQAVVLRIALTTALADAGKQMGDAYGVGVKEPAARSRFGPFSKMRINYYGVARAHLMDAMQSVMDQRRKLSGNPIPVEVTFPSFTGGTDSTLLRIKSGQWVEDGDRYSAELLADRNALARLLSAPVRSPTRASKSSALERSKSTLGCTSSS
jgi:hypothetical protein